MNLWVRILLNPIGGILLLTVPENTKILNLQFYILSTSIVTGGDSLIFLNFLSQNTRANTAENQGRVQYCEALSYNIE